MTEPTLGEIINTLRDYKILPEYQYIKGSVEEDNKIIFQELPYQPETTIHELWHILYPEITDNDEVERQSQMYLKKHQGVKSYIEYHLKEEMKMFDYDVGK